MHRIPTLLQKLTELSEQGKNLTAIDIDLMLDYTRVLYADLLEIRNSLQAPAGSREPEADNHITDTQQEQELPGNQSIIGEPVSKYAEVPSNDIRTFIGINDKYLFISELFRDEKSEYDKAIKQLNTFNTLQEATAWVEKELDHKYNWDKENETVQSFYGLLSRCFSSM